MGCVCVNIYDFPVGKKANNCFTMKRDDGKTIILNIHEQAIHVVHNWLHIAKVEMSSKINCPIFEPKFP